jgi:hypothetical protein
MACGRAWGFTPVLVLAGIVVALAACSGPDFDARGLMAPSDYCPIDPRSLGEAEQLRPLDEGNGCQIPNPWRLRSVAGVRLDNGATLNCGVVQPLNNWMIGVAQPAALLAFGEPIRSARVAASYSCRARNGARGAKMSEHGFGNAIDLSEFTLTSGRTVTVAAGWRGDNEERAFLRDLNRGACEHFSTVLGPGSDRHHHDHFHLDLAPRKSSYCR